MRHLIQLPEGSSWVVEHDKMFYTTKPTEPETIIEYLPVSVILLIDVSGSMGGDPGSNPAKLEGAKAGMRRVVNLMNNRNHQDDQLGIISFSTSARTVLNINTPFRSSLALEAIDSVRSSGYTNMSAGMDAARSALSSCDQYCETGYIIG